MYHSGSLSNEKIPGHFHEKLVPFHVKRQVITARKLPSTKATFEWFRTSVLTIMAGQLIRSSKFPITSFP